MKTKDVETDVGSTDLASYILAVTEQLKRERKFAAAHGYVSVLHSFQDLRVVGAYHYLWMKCSPLCG